MFIQLQNIQKIFGKDESRVIALENVSVNIDKGEYVAIHGPSGSGKSTLLTIMAGLQHPTKGEVVIDEISLYKELNNDGLSRFRSEYIGFVFQAFNLIPYMTLKENIMLPLAHMKLSKKEKNEKAEAIMEKVGLADRAGHLPSELSGGQQQRGAIARALINNPPILFADEPTGNLDSRTRDEILGLFTTLNSWGHSVIMVTHDPDNIQAATRAIQIVDGHVK